MIEQLIRHFITEKGWGSFLATLFEIECQNVAKKIKSFQKRIFLYLFIYAFGYACITIGLIGFSVLFILAFEKDHLIDSLFILSFFFACMGIVFIRKALSFFS